VVFSTVKETASNFQVLLLIPLSLLKRSFNLWATGEPLVVQPGQGEQLALEEQLEEEEHQQPEEQPEHLVQAGHQQV